MKKLKNNIALCLYRIILFIVKLLPSTHQQKHLLVVKTDEIGDYILFQNLFKEITTSLKYHDYKKTLVGNLAWKSVFDIYNHGLFDSVIWVDKKRFKSDLKYRFRFLRDLHRLDTSVVVNCVFSRSLDADDTICFAATGKYKVSMEADKANRKKNGLNFDKFIYSTIIKAGDEKTFDSVRNRNFMVSFLEKESISISTRFDVSPTETLPEKAYCILFLGAGNPERKWPIAHFVQAAEYIYKKYNIIPVVCGGPDDIPLSREFAALYSAEMIDMAGKTSLPYLIELLHNARLLICVDTGALHIAAAVGCPVIGLYSGKFYGRFAPYPVEITNCFYPVYPDFVDELIRQKDPVLYDTHIMKNDTMKLIPVAKILPYIDKILRA